jgi:recombination protein RecA
MFAFFVTFTKPKIKPTNPKNFMANKEVNPDKLKVLSAVMQKIEKDFGKGSIMKMDGNVTEEVAVIPSGSLTLDIALGVGGYPKGRVIEIYGPESSGKTTLALHAIAEAQKMGGIAAFIDAEHAFDSYYAQKLGIDTENLLISQPDNGEQALEIADSLIRSGAIDIVVIDSVAALTPKAEIEGDMGESKMGLQARLMSQALRKLTSSIAKTKTVCIFINQLRDKIGVAYGNPETTTGGNALKFYASVRIDIRKSTAIKDGDDVLGNLTKVKVVKNKVAPPFRRAEFDIVYGEGISRVGEILDLAVDNDIIKKSGSWFSYGDKKLGQGRDATKDLLANDAALQADIEAKVKAVLKAPAGGKEAAGAGAGAAAAGAAAGAAAAKEAAKEAPAKEAPAKKSAKKQEAEE